MKEEWEKYFKPRGQQGIKLQSGSMWEKVGKEWTISPEGAEGGVG